MDIFLTQFELQTIFGYCHPLKLREHLQKQNIPFFQDRKGRPLVSKTVLARLHLGYDQQQKFESPFALEPDFTALKR